MIRTLDCTPAAQPLQVHWHVWPYMKYGVPLWRAKLVPTGTSIYDYTFYSTTQLADWVLNWDRVYMVALAVHLPATLSQVIAETLYRRGVVCFSYGVWIVRE
jgi:hypothetical protein